MNAVEKSKDLFFFFPCRESDSGPLTATLSTVLSTCPSGFRCVPEHFTDWLGTSVARWLSVHDPGDDFRWQVTMVFYRWVTTR
jgi:hypothetical protein